MDHLVRLQFNNLLKKYDYLCGEMEVKSEISAISQGIFWENLERVIKGQDMLSDVVRSVLLSSDPVSTKSETDSMEADTKANVDHDVKGIYRSIAKVTHPDKVRNEYLNGLYVDATRMVRDNDRLGIYGIAIRLGIEVELPEGLYEDLTRRIAEIEAKIRFLESSYHMRWYYSDRQTKIDLICEYIERSMLRLSEA